MSLAQEAHIDAFALNMAVGDDSKNSQKDMAFQAAQSLGFQLFFSFDYAGNGPWLEQSVYTLIQSYAGNTAYWHRDGQPLVSTFEGPLNADDWVTLKETTGCFFIPDWSSLGADQAVALGVADGLFNWAAWPEGPNNMYTTIDDSYYDFLNGLPYMMPVVSRKPFCTNLKYHLC